MTAMDKTDPAESTELTAAGGSEGHHGEKTPTRDGGWGPGSFLRKVSLPFARNENASTKLVEEEVKASEAPGIVAPEKKNGSLESSSTTLTHKRNEPRNKSVEQEDLSLSAQSNHSEGGLLSEEGKASNQSAAWPPRWFNGNFNLIEAVKSRGNELRTAFENATQSNRAASNAENNNEKPNKARLDNVYNFFAYTEAQGRALFDEMDVNKRGKVGLEEIKAVMKKRNLPVKYARDLFKRARRHPFSRTIRCSDLRRLFDEREKEMLQAFRTLGTTRSGSVSKESVRRELDRLNLPSDDSTVKAMISAIKAGQIESEREELEGNGVVPKQLNAMVQSGLEAGGWRDASGSITYGEFRNFVVLLPVADDGLDPNKAWLEMAAVTMPLGVPPAVRISAQSAIITSALAGALASGGATAALHPVDTLKTRIQLAGKGAELKGIAALHALAKQLGRKGMYRGSIPAVTGAAFSHGLRTGAYEASRLLLIFLFPSMPNGIVQPVASGFGTFIGTGLRIPAEVVKQRLQAGLQPNIYEAVRSATAERGWRGLFRGTSAILAREVPFYALGMGMYEQFKNGVRYLKRKNSEDEPELESWELIALGAAAGMIAAIATTPADVVKTRMMTGAGAGGTAKNLIEGMVAVVSSEGVGALFKGALPRGLWIAPVGAFNFAAYELAKNALTSGSYESR